MPIARRIALFLKNYTNITPNQVTVFTFFIGVIGALLICKGSYYTDLIAIIFLQLALTFDLSDGYLARIKNKIKTQLVLKSYVGLSCTLLRDQFQIIQ